MFGQTVLLMVLWSGLLMWVVTFPKELSAALAFQTRESTTDILMSYVIWFYCVATFSITVIMVVKW